VITDADFHLAAVPAVCACGIAKRRLCRWCRLGMGVWLRNRVSDRILFVNAYASLFIIGIKLMLGGI
jgi:hypothetical protein